MSFLQRWFDQRQIEALVVGKQTPDAAEENAAVMGPLREADASTEAAKAAASAAASNQDKADSPPPTDLNSFLESV